MASISSKLAPKDKQALAMFYETETYQSFKKLLALVKRNAADKAISAPDYVQVRYLAGQKESMEHLLKEFEAIHAWSLKRD